MGPVPSLDEFVGIREGELAARIIGDVIRQKYAPALRVARYICFMAEGRRVTWEAWQQTRDGFTGSMFRHSFIALAQQIGLDEANIQIHAFATDLVNSFEQSMDVVVAGTLKPRHLDDRDQVRMRDWLLLLEKSDRELNPILNALYGPPPRKGLFQRIRLE